LEKASEFNVLYNFLKYDENAMIACQRTGTCYKNIGNLEIKKTEQENNNITLLLCLFT